MPGRLSHEELTTAVQALSHQQVRLLRLTYPNRRTKEIMGEIPHLTAGTIDQYLAKATRVLGATDRFDAAQLLAAFEAQASEKSEFRTPTLSERPISDMFEVSEARDEWRREVRETGVEFSHGSADAITNFVRAFVKFMNRLERSALLKGGCAVAVAAAVAFTALAVLAVADTVQALWLRVFAP